jgi:hypothetical protein
MVVFLSYYPSVSSQPAMIFHFVGQAILPAAAFQAALGCGCAALWGRIASCAPVCNRRCTTRFASLGKQVANQVANLPHAANLW